LLIPKSSGQLDNAVDLLDSTGIVVQLPYDLTFPFARYISRLKFGTGVLKRHALGRAFRSNSAGGQPRAIYVCFLFDEIGNRL
jgi:translation initiation factor 2-alpha kinase 4